MRAQPQRPAQIPVAAGAERVHGDAGRLDLGHQRVLRFEDVCHLVVEPLAVTVAHHVDQQLLGAAVAQAFDQHQDTPPWRADSTLGGGRGVPRLAGGHEAQIGRAVTVWCVQLRSPVNSSLPSPGRRVRTHHHGLHRRQRARRADRTIGWGGSSEGGTSQRASSHIDGAFPRGHVHHTAHVNCCIEGELILTGTRRRDVTAAFDAGVTSTVLLGGANLTVSGPRREPAGRA